MDLVVMEDDYGYDNRVDNSDDKNRSRISQMTP